MTPPLSERRPAPPAVSAPPKAVLVAFGADAEPVRFAGGKGGTWRTGGLVLKPVEFLPETLWRARVLDALPENPAFRIARPARTNTGDWVSGGWEATEFVAGEPDVTRPDDALHGGIAFHAALTGLSRPVFLDQRADPWSDGDRIAWEESPMDASPTAWKLLQPLLDARRRVGLPAQAVHGDLLGNVLFADDHLPAIIDWPLYWRPPAWASAVAVADALCWHGATPDLAHRWSHLPEWRQMLIRALIYRILTDDRVATLPAHLAAYRPAIALTTSLPSEP